MTAVEHSCRLVSAIVAPVVMLVTVAPLARGAALAAISPRAAVIVAPLDTVVLKGGKKLVDVVVSKQDEQWVVLNPFNSRWSGMTFELEKSEKSPCRIPRDRVEQVVVADPPLVEVRRAASRPNLKASDHLALAKRCGDLGLKDEQLREARRCLALEPTNEEALALAGGKAAWEQFAKGNPDFEPKLRELEHAYLAAKTNEERATILAQTKELGSTRPIAFLERARRSAAFPKRRRDKVRLTLRSESAPGATYCIHVPTSYDPLVPTGLVVGLHGGGPGGFDKTLVTGSGEEAMPFYEDVAESSGMIVVCPTALAPGWSSPKNEPLVDAVVDEMLMLYDVDETRIYVTGHSMGGGGTWHWGPKRADLWAAFAPCAGWGGPETKGLPVYIYHSADDRVVGVADDRTSACALARDPKKPDFVYTEFTDQGHGFPDWARKDVFEFFLGRWKDRGRRHTVNPESSFLRKVTKEETKAFGELATPTSGSGGATASGASESTVDESKLAELVARLEKGGGGGEEAAKELSSVKTPAAVKAVAKVLHSKKTNRDARELAARTLGEIGLAECVKPLASALEDEDFRVVDAIAVALGRTTSKEAVAPLDHAAKRMGAFWDGSIRGRGMVFTEYKVRCESFGKLCDAYAQLGDAPAAIAALELVVVERVFTPKTPYEVPADERFEEIPGAARLALVRRLRACCEALREPSARRLFQSIAAAWPKESALSSECTAAVAKLDGAGDSAGSGN